MLYRALALLALTGCELPSTFANDLEAHSTDPSFRLHGLVHQRVDSNDQPTTLIEVWVSRSEAPRGTPPPDDTIVRTADVRVGGERLVPATFDDDRYVATLDHWISDIKITATDGIDEATIEHAEMLSNPDEMNVEFPTTVPAGGAHDLTWSAQGRPVTPSFVVTTMDDPVRFTLITLPLEGETGIQHFAPSVFPVPGQYALNFVRMVQYFEDPSSEDPRITLTAITYWNTQVAAVPPPQL